MKTLLPLAFAGLVLLVAVSQATPVREQDIRAKDDELNDVARDFELDTTERYDKIHSIKLTNFNLFGSGNTLLMRVLL